MIKYTLTCPDEHPFEVWFPDSAVCDDQLQAGEVACPVCGSHAVRKALMAPSIARKSNTRGGAPKPPAPDTPVAPASNREGGDQFVAGSVTTAADTFRKALWEVRRHIESSAEHVGDAFAREARAIHEGKSEARPIYGESSEKEAEELREDGIDFARIPWPKHDA